jgi:hypothetical protein
VKSPTQVNVLFIGKMIAKTIKFRHTTYKYNNVSNMTILWNPEMQVLKNVIPCTTYISKKIHQGVNKKQCTYSILPTLNTVSLFGTAEFLKIIY